jgi:hypothetical protein
MKQRSRSQFIVGICLCLGLVASGHAQNQPTTQAAPAKEKVVTSHASGTFDVNLTPQAAEDADAGLGRMSIDKQFHGDLEGTSKGFMLASSATIVKGSGGYVAMERVTGTLKGRTGTFALQHSGTMTRGTPPAPANWKELPGRSPSRSTRESIHTSSITRCRKRRKAASSS